MHRLIALGGCFGAPDFYKDMVKSVTILPLSDYGLSQIDGISNKDIVLFGGGEDISPSIYKEPPSRWNHGPALPSTRDIVEMAAFKQAQKVGAFCYGICRGAQMLCALSGGKLVQHVTHHGNGHMLRLKDGREFLTSSVHHQMMWPFATMKKDQYEVLGWSATNRSTVYVLNDKDIRRDVEIEPEVIWFPETQSLGIQGHPEFMSRGDELVEYSRELLKTYFLDKE